MPLNLQSLILTGLVLLCPLASHGQEISLQCSGKFSDGQRHSFEVSFEESPRSVVRDYSVGTDGTPIRRDYPSQSQGEIFFEPQIDAFSVKYCFRASFHNSESKSCMEIDRKSGEFEGVNYFVRSSTGDASRTVTYQGVCELKGRVSSKF